MLQDLTGLKLLNCWKNIKLNIKFLYYPLNIAQIEQYRIIFFSIKMEIEVLLELIELILAQKGDVGDFVEAIIKKIFILDEGTLFIATKMRQIELVRFVLKSGVKPTLESFQYAAEHDFFELCRLFVEFGSRKILSTPELEAEFRPILTDGLLENFENLVNRGIDPTADDNYAICRASHKGYLDIVQLFLKHGIDTAGKNMAIQSASLGGSFEVVRLLLKYGADFKADSNKAIRLASIYGHFEVVRLLLEHGADPRDNNNMAIKMASNGGHLDIVRLLLNNDSKYKVDPKAEDNQAIRMASEMGHLEVVRLLLEHGADPTANNNDAIRSASHRGHLEVVQLLLEKGADPTANNNDAIRSASGPNKHAIIKLLKEYRVSP
jgi:ankyrin repeat protein